jgi:predicted TIM-barrel fold metal-dependent hydrolase
MSITRRQAFAATLGAAGVLAADPPVVVETHVHLFDPSRVPYAPGAPYQPPSYTLEDHGKLIAAAGLAHSIIVHPEPYQDDHRYLEYCFAHEPRPGYFRGTCLFDAFREDTLPRVKALTERWPKRIVAMRIHAVRMKSETTGPIRNRDLQDSRMAACWRGLGSLGVGVQMHFIPGQATRVYALAERFPGTVILDHMGRPGDGTPAEYGEVLKLAKLPRVVLKYSGWEYYEGDLKELTRRIYDAFGPERMVWGTLGNTAEDFRKSSARFDELLSFATGAERAKIRGENAVRLFFA